MCVNNLPRVALNIGVAGIRTRHQLIASPAPYRYATEPLSATLIIWDGEKLSNYCCSSDSSVT